jgi:hypothetical protein
VATLREILTLQQDLILEKARALCDSKDPTERAGAAYAKTLIEKSRDVSSITGSGAKSLSASEYAIRAELLVEARRLVGGVELEKVQEHTDDSKRSTQA